MQKVSWAKRHPRVTMEIQTDIPSGLRYWLARFLIVLAGHIISSKVITRRTLPVLEAE